jgi:hypothetical protein
VPTREVIVRAMIVPMPKVFLSSAMTTIMKREYLNYSEQLQSEEKTLESMKRYLYS